MDGLAVRWFAEGADVLGPLTDVAAGAAGARTIFGAEAPLWFIGFAIPLAAFVKGAATTAAAEGLGAIAVLDEERSDAGTA